MKVVLVLLALASVAVAAPQSYNRRRGTNASGGVVGGPGVTSVNAQVTNANSNRPGTVSFNGGLALASSQQVNGFGSNIGINQAQAISQNIAIPVPGFSSGFNSNRFNNRRYG
ncbi:uncharacterized protein LOC119114005 [Pollicipes pollicipes]|uniref:uncharacterized protein LOC119113806 n=1 Tax=Pollicipes pollicipes TaxID=41117 RepID=UPI0018851645|nr:uncharacterized protein LOC119113806 [Pollicipes pollicipes]XP_037094134.1 uncharacterized protein LOC119114005 [Pollicipes pollicipes]